MLKIPYIPVEQRWLLADDKIVQLLNSENPNLDVNKFVLKARYILAILICFIAFSRVVYFYVKQFFITKSHNYDIVTSIVLSLSRGYDTNNIYKLFEINDSENVTISAYSLADYMMYVQPNLITLIKLFYNSSHCFFLILRAQLPSQVRLLLLKNSISKISIYTYLRAFFLAFKEKYPNITVYTDGAMLPAHASVSFNITTVRTFHGLIQKIHPYTFPEYDSIYVYSEKEKRYLINTGIKSKVYVYPFDQLRFLDKAVVFFMADSVSVVQPDDFNSIVVMFHSLGYKIYIKSHPLNSAPKKLVDEYKISPHNWWDVLDMTYVEHIKGLDAETTIKEKKPSFVVGWESTALCEALNMGVLPINFLDLSDGAPKAVYPVSDMSLKWPDDRRIIEGLITRKYNYDDVVKSLRNVGRSVFISSKTL